MPFKCEAAASRKHYQSMETCADPWKETKKRSAALQTHTRKSFVSDLFYLSLLCFATDSSSPFPFLLVPLLCIFQLIPCPTGLMAFPSLIVITKPPESIPRSVVKCQTACLLAYTLSTAERRIFVIKCSRESHTINYKVFPNRKIPKIIFYHFEGESRGLRKSRAAK
jgi:hypothetical protein